MAGYTGTNVIDSIMMIACVLFVLMLSFSCMFCRQNLIWAIMRIRRDGFTMRLSRVNPDPWALLVTFWGLRRGWYEINKNLMISKPNFLILLLLLFIFFEKLIFALS